MKESEYICITTPFPPSVNNYYVKTRNGVFISKRGKQFRKELEKSISEQIPNLNEITDRIKVGIILYPPDKRDRDVDNYNKSLLDALTHAGIWNDDKLIDQLPIYRGEVVKYGKVVVIIMQADPIIPNNGEMIVIKDMLGE